MDELSRTPLGEDPARRWEQELAFHLEERTRQLQAEGLSAAEARRAAEREFGDQEGAKAYCLREDRIRQRRRRHAEAATALVDDVRGAWRSLVRRPRSVAAPFFVLALGVALNALVFTVVRGVLLAPLPFTDQDRVHVVRQVNDGGRAVRVAYPILDRWRREATTLEAAAAYSVAAFPVTTDDGPIHVRGATVTEGWFGLQDRPVLRGREFETGDHQAGAERVVLVSQSFWRRALGARSDAVGSSLRMNGLAYQVVGIVRDEAAFPDGAELWTTLESTYPGLMEVAGATILDAVARLRPGVSPEGANEELGRLASLVPGGTPGALVTPLRDRLVGDVGTPLLLLQGAVLLVLLAATANAGGMLLARSVQRRSEAAVRASLGASRLRVSRSLVLEGLLLGVSTGLLGLLVAAGLLGPALRLVPRELPRAQAIALDPWVALVALALATAAGALTALIPTLDGSRISVASLLHRGTAGSGTTRRLRATLDGLVVAQVAIAVLLTAGAGLLMRSMWATLAEDPGFDPGRLTVMEISLPGYSYPENADRVAFATELLERAAALPGARSVALGRNLPITGTNMTSPLVVEGFEGRTGAVQVATVSSGYFETMRIALTAGNDFGADDRSGAPPTIIVSEGTTAPDGRPLTLGDRAHSLFGASEPREVRAVAASVRHKGLRARPDPIVYLPFFQSEGAAAFALVVRSDAPPRTVASAAQALVRDIDPDLPADRVSTMSAHVRRSLAEPRFYALGLSLFGLLGLVLALAGCQAGLAHRVAAQRRELGVRMALGASAPALRRRVVRRGLMLTALGGALGLVGAVPAGRVLESQLYGVTATDPVTYVVLFALLLLAGAAASDLPARRAARLDPAETLRG